MSHISEYPIKVKKLDVLINVCSNLGFEVRQSATLADDLTVSQFGSNAVKAAVGVKIPGWGYEIAVTSDGKVKYDHFGSKPNTMDKLGKMLQEYNKEAILEESWMTQNSVETMENGAIKLVLEF